jgi:hypothetical protein
MKIAGILLSSLIIMAILSSVDLAFAAPSISIETSQDVYAYGDHLNIIIKVSEITDGDAYIYIINTEERKSLLRQLPISQEYTEILAPFSIPSGSPAWLVGTYGLEFEYSGAKSSTQFILEDTGKVGLPPWMKDLAKMWVTDRISGKEFSVAIEYMINSEIIKIPYTESDDVSTTTIPEWVKNNARWWAVGAIDDTTFTLALQYLVKTGIITVNLTNV